MIRILVPLLLALLGLGAGTGAGLALRPPAAPPETAAEPPPEEPAILPEYVKLSNQFIVPIVEDDRIVAMIILSLSLEVAQGTTEQVYAREPKLRDAFLQVLFDHANTGGFHGAFTETATLIGLRKGLLEVARKTLGDSVGDVLITDIVRQDG